MKKKQLTKEDLIGLAKFMLNHEGVSVSNPEKPFAIFEEEKWFSIQFTGWLNAKYFSVTTIIDRDGDSSIEVATSVTRCESEIKKLMQSFGLRHKIEVT